MKRKHHWLWRHDNGTYYLRVKVPIDLRSLIKKEHIKKSLRTADLRRANSLIQSEAYAVQLQFDALRRPISHLTTSNVVSTQDIGAIARRWFDEQCDNSGFVTPPILDEPIRSSLSEDQRLELEAVTHGEPYEVGRSVLEARRLLGVDAPDAIVDLGVVSELTDLLIRARRQLALLKLAQLEGDYSGTISDALFKRPVTTPSVPTKLPTAEDARDLLFALEPWLRFMTGRGMKPRQLRQYENDMRGFAVNLQLVRNVTRPQLQKFYEENLAHHAANTVIRKFSAIRNYWLYLETHDLVSRDLRPFSGLLLPKKQAVTERREWTPQQVCRLWHTARARSDHALAQAIRIAAFTGGRIEAICSLSKEKVLTASDGKPAFHFSDKTRAGIRDVPVHSAIEPMILSMLAGSDANKGFLMKAETANQYGDRSTGIGKRFYRLKTEEGFGRGWDFHSIRKTVVGLLSKASCPEAVAADIVGHEKPTMTYGLYREASDIEEKRRWIETALIYPDAGFMVG